jgi:outer membrane protein TolC
MDQSRPQLWTLTIVLGLTGCVQPGSRPEYVEVARNLESASRRPPESVRPEEPDAIVLDPPPTPPELLGPQPVDTFIRRALQENRSVQAARFNVLALKARIPQVTALDDPMASNTIYPIPSVAPQYVLMGYNAYNLMLSQQFPWFGTLRLRGEEAEEEVKVALAELCAAELDAVAAVKRAYYDLYYNQRAERILIENRALAADLVEIAKVRVQTGGSQQDYLRAEVVVTDLDRELALIRRGLVTARADLARQLHVNPESVLDALPEVPMAAVPDEIDRLYRLAIAARPELKGRLAAIARDARSAELARLRYYPNVTLGLSYMDMEKTNAQTPRTAGGFPNVGLVVGFNLPIYRQKLEAGVVEAEARAVADARLYETERDATYREVKDLLTQSRTQRDIIELFRSSILPKSERALKLATSDYQLGNVDYVTLMTAWREVLQIQLQIAQVESELGKALASLERAVGVQLNTHPPDPAAPPTPPASNTPGPFQPASRTESSTPRPR